MTPQSAIEAAKEAPAKLQERLRKSAAEYQFDADHGYQFDRILKDGSHTNPSAERSRQSALGLSEAANALDTAEAARIAALTSGRESALEEAAALVHAKAEHHFKEHNRFQRLGAPGTAIGHLCRAFDYDSLEEEIRALKSTPAVAEDVVGRETVIKILQGFQVPEACIEHIKALNTRYPIAVQQDGTVIHEYLSETAALLRTKE